MTKYNIYFKKYSPMKRDYVKFIKVVETNDIYNAIGRLICFSTESIKNVYYFLRLTDDETYEKEWEESGYEKISSDLWMYNEEGGE